MAPAAPAEAPKKRRRETSPREASGPARPNRLKIGNRIVSSLIADTRHPLERGQQPAVRGPEMRGEIDPRSASRFCAFEGCEFSSVYSPVKSVSTRIADRENCSRNSTASRRAEKLLDFRRLARPIYVAS